MLFPLPAGLSLVLAVHLVFGTVGMYKFLQFKNVGEIGSLFGALSFGLMPKLAAHFGAGHVTLIYSISWTPWLFYCSERDQRGWLSGIVAGSLFLADPRWAVYAGIFWFSYDVAHRQLGVWERAKFYFRTALIALLISAPLLVPLLEYLQFATRTKLASVDILYGSLPAVNLIGAIIPGDSGNTEWYIYAGGVLLSLYFAQVFNHDLRRKNRFWSIWIGISVLLAVGVWGIDGDWIGNIPLINLLRVPSRSLFLVGICLAIVVGSSLDEIFSAEKNSRNKMIFFGIIAVGIMMLVGVAIISGFNDLMVLWGLAFFVGTGILIMLNLGKDANSQFRWIFIGILVIDLLGAGLVSYKIQAKAMREPSPILNQVINDGEYFRIYSPSYSLEQHIAAELNLELADGVDPMQLNKYVKYVQEATGVSHDGYSVTIPPFETGNPSRDNISAIPDSKMLGKLNVKYVISEFALETSGLKLLETEGNTHLYLNEDNYPRAWVENVDDSSIGVEPANFIAVKVIEKSANKIILETSGPGRLVLSEIHYPGWRVFVDGVQEEITTSYDLFRSVVLGEGNHKVIFIFQPVTVYAGIGLASIGWTLLVIIYLRKRFEKLSG
jgi:predicted nucleic acid-binding Zn ribbon protein